MMGNDGDSRRRREVSRDWRCRRWTSIAASSSREPRRLRIRRFANAFLYYGNVLLTTTLSTLAGHEGSAVKGAADGFSCARMKDDDDVLSPFSAGDFEAITLA